MSGQQFRCNSCRGTYTDRQENRAIYFHACPPAAPDTSGVPRELLNKRDENISAGRPHHPPAITSEGDGVVCITMPQLREPTWITEMKRRAAAEELED